MIYDVKTELIDSINILHDLAYKSSPKFLVELCRFLTEDIYFKNAYIFEEVDTENNFSMIAKSSESDSSFLPKITSLDNYESLLESCKYENNFVSECNLNLKSSNDSILSFFLNVTDLKRYALVLVSKSLPSNNEKVKFLQIAKFVQKYLQLFNKSEKNSLQTKSIRSIDFLEKTTSGLTKDLKTISGLLTLLKEEKLPISIDNYIDEVKIINNYLLESIEHLETLAKIESSTVNLQETTFNVDDIIDRSVQVIKTVNTDCKFELVDRNNFEILFDENIFEFIVSHASYFISSISKSKHVTIGCKLTPENILRFNFITETLDLNVKDLENVFEPFENQEYSKFQSGLALTLLNKYIEILDGTFKFTKDISGFSLNIALPIKNIISTEIKEILPVNNTNSQDKILVIESDNASSSLLKNYLRKWNYQTEFVSSGNQALRLLEESKYVAVILNIEQENDNSLILLQKIKNTKATRNTPVIVFSVEAEKEKIYLMGSVDYLVKPINYNNLVEILTSYKLRRNSTVLCVDDDKPTLNLLKQAVQTAGFNVISEHRPDLVMDLISGKDLDLAIIDLDMPIINGFDLIKKIKSEENFSKLPIIIYTGKEDYHEDLQKIDGMFVDLLQKKSTSFNELENTITAMIKAYEEPNTEENSENESLGPKILMAEDYKHSQIIVTRLLKKSGFENIIVVENGEEALNICESDKIDLILMDMQMPVMNGFEATGKIRELSGYADTPIIALTAFAMKGDREKCLEAGATDYIPKPIDSKEFIEKVKYYTQISISA